MKPAASAALLAGLAIAALLAERLPSVGVIAAVLLTACLRAPGKRRRVYLVGVLVSSAMVVVLSPFLQATGSHPLWNGPIVPVLGSLDVTSEELRIAALNGLRLASVGLAFTCFALLLDHDQLVASAGWARRSALAVGLATRLLPTLERDGAGLVESLRGRGLVVEGPRAYAALLSPLLASSLERGLNLAEAMEARGFGRPGRTRVPGRKWAAVDVMAVSTAITVVVLGAWWL